jgi:hypothetical protein
MIVLTRLLISSVEEELRIHIANESRKARQDLYIVSK